MEKYQEHIRYLWNQFIEDKSTATEVEELITYIKNNTDDVYINEFLAMQIAKYQSSDKGDEDFWSESLARILQIQKSARPTSDLKLEASSLSKSPSSEDKDFSDPPLNRVHFLRTAWFRYAAILLLMAGTATYLYHAELFGVNTELNKATATLPSQDILAGGNRAILTLSDGSTIILDKVAKGQVASQGNTKILKIDEGALAYQSGVNTSETVYNTISTPRGGQYQIILPDQTKVWLNAASSIKFPVVFTGPTRSVEITGEVYMEVAENARQSFQVKTKDLEVQVLGTRFNINAYIEEPVVTATLLSGSIRVITASGTMLLHPGNQACLEADGLRRLNSDIKEVMAWKNGAFYFNNTSLTKVMRQLARWYNVEIEYAPAAVDELISGGMGRDLNLSEVLEGLRGMGIHTRLEGKKIIILKK